MEQDHKDENQNKKAKNASKTFRRLFAYTWKEKMIFFMANFSLVMSSIGFILLPLICGQMVDVIKDGESLTEGTLKFIILTVFMAIFSSIRGYMFNILGEKIMVALRK
jgi:ABC-type multidrug transport system fused ATPase/permease subunit